MQWCYLLTGVYERTTFLKENHHLYLFSSKVVLMYKFLNLVDVFGDFMFSGKAFHIITPVYDKDL